MLNATTITQGKSQTMPWATNRGATTGMLVKARATKVCALMRTEAGYEKNITLVLTHQQLMPANPKALAVSII